MSFDSFYFLRSAQNLLFLYDFFLLAVYVRFILLQGGKTSMDVPSAIETFFFPYVSATAAAALLADSSLFEA